MQEILKKLDTSSWKRYKKSLGEVMEFAEEMGVSENLIGNLAQHFGNFLAENVDPDLPENHALKELWQIASPEEQKTLTTLMMKLAQGNH